MTTNSSYSFNGIGTLVAMAGTNPIYADSLNFPDHPSPITPSSLAFQPDPLAITLNSSHDLAGPTIAPVTKAHGWAAKENWARHQALIKQLYLYEKKPLAEVMRLMESQHDFKATLAHQAALCVTSTADVCRVKMYKTHIKQWGLDKKNKDFEMRAIVRKNKKRSDQGKGSIIRVRGQLRDFAEVVRYWDRKGVSIDDIIARQTASPTPEAVEFFTPVPSPILTSQVLIIPERMFRGIRDYFKGSFESGTWVKTDSPSPCWIIEDEANAAGDDLNKLFIGCEVACSLLKRSLFHEAGRSLIAATAYIKNILLAEHPESLVELFRLIAYLCRRKRDEMALIILRQFSALGKVLLGSEHPLSRICEWVGSVYASNFFDVVIRCMETIADQFGIFLGSLDETTIFSRLNFIAALDQEPVQMMQQLLADCEKALGQYDLRTLWARGYLAEEYFARSYYVEARTLSQKNIACSHHVQSVTTRLLEQNENLYTIAKCQYALGEVHLGILTLHRVIDSNMSTWGPEDSRARYWLSKLEGWYGEQGDWSSAARVRDWREKILDSMDMD